MELINELCLRLPWGLKGYLIMDTHETGDPHMIVELKGVDISKPSPTLIISVPGFSSTWNCSLDRFIPILRAPTEGDNLDDLIWCFKNNIDVNNLIGRGLAKNALSN